jgi:exodeoxyribonuclease-3
MFTKEGELYTWWDMKTRARDRNVGWRIDYFFVSQSLKNKVKNAYILSDVYGSDHCPVVLELDI